MVHQGEQQVKISKSLQRTSASTAGSDCSYYSSCERS